MGSISLFPTQIHLKSLSPKVSSRLNRELLSDIKTIRRMDKVGRDWSKENYVAGYTSYSSISDVHQRFGPFMELRNLIDREVKKYLQTLKVDLMGREVEMTTCWINVMPRHCAHSLHLHPLCFISGTYYVQVPKGSGSLKLEDPRLGLFMGSPPRKKGSPYFYELQPKAGQVALWESWLRHEVTANKVSQERISVSFNYEWT